MITASTSSRFTAEATAAPIASIARSISSTASSSPWSSARAKTPLVSRSRPRLCMILKSSVGRPSWCALRARASIAPRPA
jgi:hypothetical protein